MHPRPSQSLRPRSRRWPRRASRHALSSTRLASALFLETIEADPVSLDAQETIRIVEDYKPLDIESATMALALCRGIRVALSRVAITCSTATAATKTSKTIRSNRIQSSPLRSVINNPMLYQEGWGVGKIKHSLTYSGGLSRSYTRTYAPAHHFGFAGIQSIHAAQRYRHRRSDSIHRSDRLQRRKTLRAQGRNCLVAESQQLTGLEMPVFPKRRFQHGALAEDALHRALPFREAEYRKQFLSLVSVRHLS